MGDDSEVQRDGLGQGGVGDAAVLGEPRPSIKAVRRKAELKCLYTNARSLGNKQDELETVMCLENYDLVAITETWWDDSHNWNTTIEGYRLFRRDRLGRKGGGVALYVKEWIDCEELPLRNSHDQVESLWVRIRNGSNKGQLVIGVYYRPPDQGETVDEAFLLQMREASCSRALVLMGDFNHPDISWIDHMASCKRSGGSWNVLMITFWSRCWTDRQR